MAIWVSHDRWEAYKSLAYANLNEWETGARHIAIRGMAIWDSHVRERRLDARVTIVDEVFKRTYVRDFQMDACMTSLLSFRLPFLCLLSVLHQSLPSTTHTWIRHPNGHTYDVSAWQVSFAKEPYKRDYILQKRRITLRSLLWLPSAE